METSPLNKNSDFHDWSMSSYELSRRAECIAACSDTSWCHEAGAYPDHVFFLSKWPVTGGLMHRKYFMFVYGVQIVNVIITWSHAEVLHGRSTICKIMLNSKDTYGSIVHTQLKCHKQKTCSMHRTSLRVTRCPFVGRSVNGIDVWLKLFLYMDLGSGALAKSSSLTSSTLISVP